MDKPILPTTLKRFYRNGKVIVINPDVPSWIVTDQLGELILDLFDGNNDLDSIVDIAVDGIGEAQRPKVLRFCQELAASHLFETPAARHRQPYVLHIVHLALAEGCNLKCKYCYAAERIRSERDCLSLEEYKSVIDGICEINPEVSFTLTGGEPLLNHDWRAIAEHIKGKGCECLLMTNGTLVDQSNIADIKKYFDTVYLSVDGSSAEKHARTRGDNFDKVMHAVDLLRDNDIDYSLSMTVCRTNMEDVEATAHRFGSRLRFAPLFPVSDMASDELSISGIDYYRVLKKAAGVAPMSYCESSLDSALVSPCMKCALGDGEISISASGDVYPCQLLHMPEFRAGNVREESIIRIYESSDVIKRFKSLSVDDFEECKDCAFKYICGGACRARSFYECGDIMKTGDFCQYEKEAYLDGIVQIYSSNLLDS